MSRKRILKTDLAALKARAFRHAERCGELVRQFHGIRRIIRASADQKLIWLVYDWLVTPYTLWPIDLEGLARHILSDLRSGRSLDANLRLLIWFLGEPPTKRCQETIGAFEHQIVSGRYEGLLRQPQKFDEHEAMLATDAELQEAWTLVKKVAAPGTFRSANAVIRRRMSEERNFRRGWQFDWSKRRSRFQLLFDAMCYRWCLYGMEGDKPLLLKVSVNPTPHGTLIMIPRHWSIDGRRDLNWKAIGELHRSHGSGRQGPKLSLNRLGMFEEAIAAKTHYDDGRKRGLRGEGLLSHVLNMMGKAPGTDASWLKRRLKLLAMP